MDLKRLRAVRDICPLACGPNRAIYTTNWRAESVPPDHAARIFDGGYTTTVVHNRILTWYRTFTHVAAEPPPETFDSLFHIHEWIPPAMPKNFRGWFHLPIPHHDGIAFFTHTPHTASWSAHARRHLAVFKKCNEIFLEIGTAEDFAKNIVHAQVPNFFHTVFIELVGRHLTAHADSIEILVARHVTGAVAACFVSGYCDEINQAYYITGFFDARFGRTHAMTGLIDWWMTRARSRGCTAANFGDMCGPRPLPLDSNIGYSNFKTHFGVQRVWFPRGFWKFAWRGGWRKK